MRHTNTTTDQTALDQTAPVQTTTVQTTTDQTGPVQTDTDQTGPVQTDDDQTDDDQFNELLLQFDSFELRKFDSLFSEGGKFYAMAKIQPALTYKYAVGIASSVNDAIIDEHYTIEAIIEFVKNNLHQFVIDAFFEITNCSLEKSDSNTVNPRQSLQNQFAMIPSRIKAIACDCFGIEGTGKKSGINKLHWLITNGYCTQELGSKLDDKQVNKLYKMFAKN